MRKVLVIAYYFPPMGLSGVQRTLKFVKYLPEYDWEPIVLTTNAPAYYAYDNTLIDEINQESIKIYRTEKDITKYVKKSSKDTDQNVVKYPSRFTQFARKTITSLFLQPDSRILWKKQAIKLAELIFQENKIDAIYATAPPYTDFIIAQELSAKYNVPFIIDYRDLWVDNAFYIYPTPFHKLYAMKLENEILQNSSKAIVINRFMKESLLRRYRNISHSDVSIIPHGFDASDFNIARKHINKSDKFIITHSGLFPDDLTPEYFLKALKIFLEKNPNAKNQIEVRFVGILRKQHFKLIKKFGLEEYCILTGYIDHISAVRNLLESDVLWMMITNNIATPSRLYEYFGAGKAMIICAPDGNIKELAESSGSAYTTNPKDVEGISFGLDQFYSLWKNNKLPKIHEGFAERFDRRELTADLSRELMLTQT